MKRNKKNLAKYKEADLKFHLALYEMTENPFIMKVTNMIHDILDTSMGTAITAQGAEEGIEYHSKILANIKSRNKVGLEKVTRELFDLILKELSEESRGARSAIR
jgi:DNA-binding FadR family transcriptional regulator